MTAAIFAAYLDAPSVNRHVFLAVRTDDTGQLCVYTASGIVAHVDWERIYNGPAKQPVFATEKHAIGYAKAIMRSKLDRGYAVAWSTETDALALPRPIGVIPEWFEDLCTSPVMTLAASPQEDAALNPPPAPKLRKPTTKEHDHDDGNTQAFYGWKPRH